MQEQLLSALKHWFGYDSFLDHQRSVMESVLSGKDLCVVMPTGAGKSLCYQLPLLMKERYSIIVSPLISLMKDQVDALVERKIPAAFINTTVPPATQYAILREVERGALKLLYVAPERFQAPGFREFIREIPPKFWWWMKPTVSVNGDTTSVRHTCGSVMLPGKWESRRSVPLPQLPPEPFRKISFSS